MACGFVFSPFSAWRLLRAVGRPRRSRHHREAPRPAAQVPAPQVPAASAQAGPPSSEAIPFAGYNAAAPQAPTQPQPTPTAPIADLGSGSSSNKAPLPATPPPPSSAAIDDAAQPAAPKHEGQIYPATLENVLKAGVKLGAFDLADDKFIDDFARVVHCDIYTHYFGNEFDWRKIRTAMRASIEQEKDAYPTTVYVERDEEFTRFDFQTGMLDLAPSSVMHRTARLQLYSTPARSAAAGSSHFLPSSSRCWMSRSSLKACF